MGIFRVDARVEKGGVICKRIQTRVRSSHRKDITEKAQSLQVQWAFDSESLSVCSLEHPPHPLPGHHQPSVGTIPFLCDGDRVSSQVLRLSLVSRVDSGLPGVSCGGKEVTEGQP